MKIPKMGLGQMLKPGYQINQGLEEAVFRNIEATKSLSEITRTSLGPNGRNKMVINHLEKLFVTNDAATIIRELEVVHPAAKLLVMASQQQEVEMGDGTNFVVVFAGELLQMADYLLRMGLHPAEVIAGYQVACKRAIQLLQDCACDTVEDLHSATALTRVVRSVLASKQYGYEDLLAKVVVEAALEVMPKNPAAFSVDSVRVVKVMGGSIHETKVVRGMVFGREPDSTVQKANKAKIAIYTCALDVSLTETKGTVLIHNANEMMSFNKGEEKQLEELIRAIADSGVKVIVTGSGIGELALHFCNRFGLVVVKILSKFELRRLCRVIGATGLTRLGVPLAEEMGYCEVVETIEIGSDRCTVFRQESELTKTATIVVRGGTMNSLEDLERAIDDGVNSIKALVKDARVCPGAGATEIQIAHALMAIGEKTPGLNQYSIMKFAEALEVIPRTLSDNAGVDSTEVLSKLYASQVQGKKTFGVDIEGVNGDLGIIDCAASGIVDILAVKQWAIKLATHAAITVLSVDQIIMSKPAGGPKVPKQDQFDDED